MRGAHWSVLLALLPALLAGSAAIHAARAEDAAPGPEAGLAPPGCWTMRDGCPAGTGSVRTPGIRAPFQAAWTFETPASTEIEEAPRIWEDLVFLAVKAGTDQRTLHVLGLGDGQPLAKPVTIQTNRPLDPCVWNDVILIRESSDLLGAYRLDDAGLTRVHEVRGTGALHAPILHDGHVYAVDGDTLTCWRLGRSEPAWRLTGSFRGSLALRGRTLFALSVDTAGNITLVSVDRRTGSQFPGEFIGHWQRDGVPPEGVIASVAAMRRDVFVQHVQDLAIKGEGTARTSWLRRVPVDDHQSIMQNNGLLGFEQSPVETGGGWLARERGDDGGSTLRLSHAAPDKPRKTTGWILASKKQRSELVAWGRPFSVAGDIAYIGGFAFDWRTRVVAWESCNKPLLRPVPAHDTLLVVRSPRRLVALRERGAALGGALFTGRAHAVGTPDATEPLAVEGAALFADGTCHEGAYEIGVDGRSLTLLEKKGRRTKRLAAPLGKVRLLLDEEDRLLYVGMPATLGSALQHYHFLRLVKDYVKLAKDAYRTYDPALMKRLIDAAAARGASERELKHPRKQQAALVSRPRKHDEKQRDKILARELELSQQGAARIQKTLASVLDDPRWPVQQAFVRRLLMADPDNERASALVRARLPDFLPTPTPFSALDWIDLADSLQRTSVTQLQPPKGQGKDLTRREREFGSALHVWRKDLVGLESGEMLILTPLARPGRIGGCLSMGTLVCQALEDVFSSGAAVRTKPYPLIMHLYETEKEYLDHSVSGRGRRATEKRDILRKTVGHYDPEGGITRLFMPPVPDAWRSVMATYAHELTHHWIEERCPLFESRAARRSSNDAGYWIVEGMADFLEEFRWDLKRRTWSTDNPRARSLDIVANASPQQLIPWQRLYALNGAAFFRLSRDDAREVPMRWQLGFRHKLSEWQMFYAQAAATTHYLYHAGEKQRAALLEFVAAYYTHQVPAAGDVIQACFGMSSDDLGRHVVEWARTQNRRQDDP